MPGERISSLALMRDLIPFDANIDYGMVVCHASGSVTINGVSTPTTDRSIVLPNHANARLAGRAFAGICQQQGDQPNVSVSTPLDLTVDNQILVQKSWIAECRLKLNTACVVGTLAAYDPADGGPVVPFTSDVQEVIGRFTETVASSSSRRLVGVELFGATGSRKGLLGRIAGPSTVLDQPVGETAYDKTIIIPAKFLQPGQVLRVTGLVRSTATGANASVVKVKLGSRVLATGPSVTLGNGDVVPFLVDLDLRASADLTAVPTVPFGMIGAGAAGTATMRAQGAAAANIDTSVALTLQVTIQYGAVGAGDSTELEALVAEIKG